MNKLAITTIAVLGLSMGQAMANPLTDVATSTIESISIDVSAMRQTIQTELWNSIVSEVESALELQADEAVASTEDVKDASVAVSRVE